MHLKVHTMKGIVFDGEVLGVEIPTKDWQIGILPSHNPLTSIVSPWLLKILPKAKRGSEFLSDTQFLFEDEKIAVAIGDGFMYTDGEVVELFVIKATTNPQSDEQALQEMKQKLQAEIQQIKSEGNQDEVERAYLNLQKLKADIKLVRIKERFYKK